MKNREDITQLLNFNSIGCELGVFKGDFSQILLNSNKFKELHLVDLFSGNVESGDKNGNNVEVINGDLLFNNVIKRFANTCAVIHKRDSVSFLRSCPDRYFDFIYIDTNHQYQQTLDELELSMKKVKNSGLICGHDYNEQGFKELFNAVNDFSSKNNIPFTTTTEDGLNSYIFQINHELAP